VVLYSGNAIRGYGNVIILRHSEEFVTVYAHNQSNFVEEGMRVEKGQVLATNRKGSPTSIFRKQRSR
jgi:lipoprotein NlpD